MKHIKECRICKKIKPITHYYLRPESNTYRTECRPCRAEICSRQRRVIGSVAHCKILFRDARNRSNKRGNSCTITRKEIQNLATDTCPILGIKLEIGSDNWQNSPSLDRIDNTKGYEKGNVIMVSHMANSIKNQATPSQIKKVADFYMKLYAEKGITV